MELRKFIESKGFKRLSLHRMESGHYSCKVILNAVQGVFILDTGASTSCVGFDYATKFKMKTEKSDVIAAGAGSSSMTTLTSKNNILQLGNLQVSKMDFVLFDLSHVNQALSQVDPQQIHGILGADFLKSRRAVIDYGRNCLYLK